MNEEGRKIKIIKKKQRINKKKVCILLLCLVSIVFFSMAMKKTFSRYQSKASSEADVDIAFWLVSDTIQEQNVVLEGLAPGETKKSTISVSNNNGTIRSNAAIEYKLILNTTTYLPLTYEIYKKTETEDILCDIESNELYEEDGTYYREIIVNGLELGCLEDETTILELRATFPGTYDDMQLADLIECVNLKIDAKQKISE